MQFIYSHAADELNIEPGSSHRRAGPGSAVCPLQDAAVRTIRHLETRTAYNAGTLMSDWTRECSGISAAAQTKTKKTHKEKTSLLKFIKKLNFRCRSVTSFLPDRAVVLQSDVSFARVRASGLQ